MRFWDRADPQRWYWYSPSFAGRLLLFSPITRSGRGREQLYGTPPFFQSFRLYRANSWDLKYVGRRAPPLQHFLATSSQVSILGRFPHNGSFLPLKTKLKTFPRKLTIWLALSLPPNRRGGGRMFAGLALISGTGTVPVSVEWSPSSLSVLQLGKWLPLHFFPFLPLIAWNLGIIVPLWAELISVHWWKDGFTAWVLYPSHRLCRHPPHTHLSPVAS